MHYKISAQRQLAKQGETVVSTRWRATLERFQEAIQATHDCEATFTGARVRITEEWNGQTVWDGIVLVFDLQDHPSAKTCYAWSVDGRVTAVLHEGPVDSPEAAVRAAIAAEHKEN